MLRTQERHLKRVTLELGLKVFKKLDDESVAAQCHVALDNWRRLIEDAEQVAVLLWIGDGDEVFNWRGKLDDEIKWDDNIGFNNLKYNAYPRSRHYETWYARPYMKDPPTVTYRDVRRIVKILKATARKMFGIDLLVGETIDAGPEFVESKFKFERHPEILKGGPDSELPKSLSFLCCYAKMNGDDYPYAGFPKGLPEETTFGTFLGRQFQGLADAVGFDYLWLSNGFGVTHYAWSYIGEVFNGLKLRPELAPESIRSFTSFWKDFRRECPKVLIEIRGTNYSIGMDATVHGIDIREIYKAGHLKLAAPNPPWGSVNLDLEMVSHMSRISSTPSPAIPLRYYVCDNWFAPIPWYDYYNREPFDIFCPMSVCRLEADGRAATPNSLHLFSINTGFGEMIKSQALEIEPHMRRAFDAAPDEAGPLVWLYPFSEYQDEPHKSDGQIQKSFFGDWFISKSIAGGVPLNTVVTTDNFAACIDKAPAALAGRTLVVPTPAADWTYADKVLDFVRAGGQALFYGSLHDAPKSLLRALNVAIDEPIEGSLDVNLKMAEDDFAKKPLKRRLKHIGRLNDGGITETLANPADRGTTVRASVSKGGKRRVYTLVRRSRSWKGGCIGWIRGTLPFDARPDSLEPKMFPAGRHHNAGYWLRYLLRDFGFDVRHDRTDAAQRAPYFFASRSRGSYFLTGHAPGAPVPTHVRMPEGAPILNGLQVPVRNSTATYHIGRTLHAECQAFVQQDAASLVRHTEWRSTPAETRVFRLSGLKDATVSLFVPREALAKKKLRVQSILEYVIQDPTVDLSKIKGVKIGKDGWPVEPMLDYEVDPVSGAAVVRNVTGSISVTY